MAPAAIALTFGSFYFAPDVDQPQEMTQSEFFDGVRRCLRGIDGVSNLVIDLDGPDDDPSVEIVPTDTAPEDEYLGPHWGFAKISFDLAIPAAVQTGVDPLARFGHLAERFRVQLGYGWTMPVSCVEVISDAIPRVTAAARVVYLYLKREVERSAERLSFGCIPPIFTHAEFFLYPAQKADADQQFWVKGHTQPAYHRYEYYFDADATTEPAVEFFWAIEREIDLYFRSEDASRSEIQGWDKISSSIEDLTDANVTGRRRFPALRVVRRGTQIRDAAISLTRFAAQRQLVASELDRQARATYSGGTVALAQELLDQELADRVDYPIEQFSQLVRMFESGRVVELQIAVAIFAALIGAVIGAIATLLAAA